MVEEEVDGGVADPGDAEHGGAGVNNVSPWPWWGGEGLFESDEFRFQGGEPGLELARAALGVDCQLGGQVGDIAGPVAALSKAVKQSSRVSSGRSPSARSCWVA